MIKKEFGILSAIFGHMTFEETVLYAKSKGLSSLELACWPKQKESRRYAGTSHFDTNDLSDEHINYVTSFLKKHDMQISSLGYYPNPLDPNEETRQAAIQHIYRLIDASKALKVNMITTFIGRNKHLSLEDNLNLYEKVWTPIITYAEKQGVRIAIENCPMWFTYDEYPGGLNLATSPHMFNEMFKRIPNQNFGLNFDPSHFVWQHMNYIDVLNQFKDRIFHIHIKDVKVYQDKLDYYGTLVPPLHYMAPKLPGLGDINWRTFLSKLDEINYKGHCIIEFEDKSFESSFDQIDEGIKLTINYLKSIQ